MDFKDWIAAVIGGKTLYRILPTVNNCSYYKSLGQAAYVEKWAWYWPFGWSVVYGLKKLTYAMDFSRLESYEKCKFYIDSVTTMYEREQDDS